MSFLKTILKIPTKAQIAFIKLDASLSENHNRTAKVTDNEVEDGSDVSDHIKLNPEGLTIQGQISEHPISILGLGVSTDDVLGKANDFLDGTKSPYEGLIKNERRTPKEAWEYLNGLMDIKTPFSVVTALKRYENMVLVNLSAPKTAKNGKDLIFNAELRKIKIVSTTKVFIPAFKTTEPGAASKGELGKQASGVANQAQTDNSSLLLKGFKKVGIFDGNISNPLPF